ncbi:hypothetical protein J7E25_05950 [Agromyces sp. ISL-38]|uniref:hypothetical protein n=1 Tax=Agromyces sp. ISL-38 TaxID=2819107 RepID=UPI001BED1FE0|nr:hypothetical protein [Agromyces sp. ISL-38]MBT2498632.1 hypothetical protein [Agromyces sp. ISL-38]
MSQSVPPEPPAQQRPITRRPLFWLIIAIVLLLIIAIAILIGMALGSTTGTGPTASPTATPTSSEAPSEAPTSTPTPTESVAPETPAAVELPSSCDGIYTRDWSADLAPRVLNPAYTADPASGFKRYGSNDVGLVTVLEATTVLECNWVPETNAGHVFLVTGVATLTPEQQSSTLDYLAGTDFDCYQELEGTRCVVEGAEGGENWGESHFVREGIWIATRWGGSGPSGYTHDIVAAIFG